MDRINGANVVVNNGLRQFQDQNLSAGIAGTEVTAAWLNDAQEELVGGIITKAGVVPTTGVDTQVMSALATMLSANWSAITAHGSGTLPVPAWASRMEYVLVGAGGGGAECQAGSIASNASGGGGGAGGYAAGVLAVTEGGTVAYTVGQGGSTQAVGGASTLGSPATVTANGGGGASFQGAASSAGAGGGVTTGASLLNLLGGDGSDGQSGNYPFAGNGAPGPFGGGGRAGAHGGEPAHAPGAGGGGAYDLVFTNTLYLGGAGADGCLLYRWLP